MEIKKYPHATLENYSKIFVELGLVLSLFVVQQSFQMKSYPSEVKALTGTYVSVDDIRNDIDNYMLLQVKIKTESIKGIIAFAIFRKIVSKLPVKCAY